MVSFFFFQAEDGIRDYKVTGVQTCALPIFSKYHEAHPFTFGGKVVHYEPAEAVEKIKGGNSNWRGPIWFPTTFLLIEALVKFDDALLSQFEVETPGAPGQPLTPRDIAKQ